MATKNNPGEFDCYAAADPDEPIFILRANDELAPIIVRMWTLMRNKAPMDMLVDLVATGHREALQKSEMSYEKFAEAIKCASDMEEWKKSHGK